MSNQEEQILETDLSKNPSIRRLQYVLDVILREDYENILMNRDEIYDKVSQHVQLQKLLKEDLRLLKHDDDYAHNDDDRNKNNNNNNNHQNEDKTILHDVGCNVYVQAKLLEPKVVHMNIGCGVIVAMTVEEALKFSKKAEDIYRARGEKLTRDSLNAKYKMRLVMEAIMRLQDIQVEKDVSKRR